MTRETSIGGFGGRYLVQDQDHMPEVPVTGKKADTKASAKTGERPLTGTPSGGWVKPEKGQKQVELEEAGHAGLTR